MSTHNKIVFELSADRNEITIMSSAFLDKRVDGYNILFKAINGKNLTEEEISRLPSIVQSISKTLPEGFREAAIADLNEIFELEEDQAATPTFEIAAPPETTPMKDAYQRHGWTYLTKPDILAYGGGYPQIRKDTSFRELILKLTIHGQDALEQEEQKQTQDAMKWLAKNIFPTAPIDEMKKAFQIFPENDRNSFFETFTRRPSHSGSTLGGRGVLHAPQFL